MQAASAYESYEGNHMKEILAFPKFFPLAHERWGIWEN